MTSRVVLIGIDGLDMDLLDGWFKDEELPNIKGLVSGGASAGLRSVVPLNSAAAWTSLITGRNPAGHGIFGFTRTHPDGYRRHTVRSDDIGAPPLWDIVNQFGAPVGLINCPMTYPPPPLNGFVISGILIPYNQLWAYPPDVEEGLRDRFGPYIVDLPWWDLSDGTPGRRESFLAGMYQMARKREEVALWTMRNLEWRVLAVIFTGTDRLMHSSWHLSDPDHPSYDSAGADAHGRDIHRYFILLDEIIGRILESAGEESRVILASDHGFGPLHHRFHLRRWLINRQYLVETPVGAHGRAPLHDDALDEPLRGIDWEQTVAYPASLSESGIWINKAGRQHKGIVPEDEYEKLRERIARQLLESRPDSAPVIERVYRREEILSGPYIEEAPDLLLVPGDKFLVDDAVSTVELEPSTRETATHRLTGIFAASGHGLRSGVRLKEMSIVDVLPTLLVAADLPVPAELEGKPAVEAFESPPEIKQSTIILSPSARRALPVADDEEKAMKEQLKGIGYL